MERVEKMILLVKQTKIVTLCVWSENDWNLPIITFSGKYHVCDSNNLIMSERHNISKEEKMRLNIPTNLLADQIK